MERGTGGGGRGRVVQFAELRDDGAGGAPGELRRRYTREEGEGQQHEADSEQQGGGRVTPRLVQRRDVRVEGGVRRQGASEVQQGGWWWEVAAKERERKRKSQGEGGRDSAPKKGGRSGRRAEKAPSEASKTKRSKQKSDEIVEVHGGRFVP